jgi:putative ABC transport system ATP-binding protein
MTTAPIGEKPDATALQTRSSDVMVTAERVTKIFGKGLSEVSALRGIDLSINRGEFLTIMGPSGCGKSTLLHILSGIEPPTSGRVFLDGQDLLQLNDTQRSVLRRRRIGFVFQKINLLPTLSAVDNVALPLRLDGVTRRAALPRAFAALESAGIAHRAHHRPNDMSGGEAQRIAIARAVVTDPAVIFCDEPTGSLDTESGQKVVQLFRRLTAEHSQTFVVVTHDATVAAEADRMIQMRDGRIVDQDNLTASRELETSP